MVKGKEDGDGAEEEAVKVPHHELPLACTQQRATKVVAMLHGRTERRHGPTALTWILLELSLTGG